MKLNLTPILQRSDFVEATYKLLVDAITDGSIAPGERITQEEIAEQLGVSRSPVLQALRLLKKDGFIEDAPGRGVQVAQLNVEWVAHLYQVRGALDGLAARLAADRKYALDASLISQGRSLFQGDDLKASIEADMAFHMAIYTASGNPLIAQSAAHHWMHLRRVMGYVHRFSPHRCMLWDEHQSIADAIAQGDAERAMLLSDLHVKRASENAISELRKLRIATSAAN